MEKLRAAGMFGGDAIPLSGSLAKRYNECLGLLGVTPTELPHFTIDGMGWSPEIALEKGDNFYLNTGAANVNAILISPDQKGKAVYMPSHSFDRDVMQAIFGAYERQIKDITKDSAIIAHLDQHIDAFFEPFDLLRYDRIEVRFMLLHDLGRKQQEQQELITVFNTKNNFIDREVHHKLLQSAQAYGDLRNRRLALDPLTLEVGSFYTRAFEGVFVLKEFITPILVFEDDTIYKKAIDDTLHDVLLYHVGHRELLDTLVRHLIVEPDLEHALKSERYMRIRNHLFAHSLSDTAHSLRDILHSELLFKKYLNELDPVIQKKINGVELFLQKQKLNKTIKPDEFVDMQYYKSLHKPHSSLELEEQDLVWKLMAIIMPNDPLHLFWYNKEQFYQDFLTWDPAYQDWVIEMVIANSKKQNYDT